MSWTISIFELCLHFDLNYTCKVSWLRGASGSFPASYPRTSGALVLTTPIFKLLLHFDLNYTPVKFRECMVVTGWQNLSTDKHINTRSLTDSLQSEYCSAEYLIYYPFQTRNITSFLNAECRLMWSYLKIYHHPLHSTLMLLSAVVECVLREHICTDTPRVWGFWKFKHSSCSPVSRPFGAASLLSWNTSANPHSCASMNVTGLSECQRRNKWSSIAPIIR